MKSDEEILKKIENSYVTDEQKALIVASLSDDKKIELLDTVKDEYRSLVILSLNEDSKKIELLDNKNLSEFEKADVISKLNNDSDKINVLKSGKIESQRNIETIISSLKEDDNKIEFLNMISLDYLKSSVIASFDDDNKKLELLNTVKDRATVVASLKNQDDKKLELLNSFKDEEDRYVIILSLSSDESKIKAINSVSKILWLNIIDTFENDENKKQLLETLGNLLPQVYQKGIFARFKHFISSVFSKITSKSTKNDTI